jgi:hypothetical protein
MRSIDTPGEMMNPDISSRMEQPHETAGQRISCSETRRFVTIASRATQAEIVKPSAASSTVWDDVVHLKGNPHHPCGTQTIGASVLRGGQDCLTERLRDTRHALRLEQAQSIGGLRFDQSNVIALFE